ncbi:hypothetical protein [Geodermatophilus sp. CPCC 205506]|uniref:tetratricopeptide repeat protein n=1 Tax=Geodermatophilus sp. CPCC 205506 TaxID=2936596 RepID=UPI003EECF9B5
MAAARRRLRAALRRSSRGNPRRHALTAAAAAQALRAEMDQAGGSVPLELAAALGVVADLHIAAMDLQAATDALNDALAVIEHAGRSLDASAVRCDVLARRGLVRRMQARWEESRTDLDLALALAPDPLRRALAHNGRGILAKDTGDLNRAAAHYSEAFGLLTTAQHADSSALAALEHNLAGLWHAHGHYAEAERHIRRALAQRVAKRRLPLAADVLRDQGVLVAVLAGQRRYAEAEPLARNVIAAWTRLRGADHYEVGHARYHLASILKHRGDTVTAAHECQEACRILAGQLGPDHPELTAVREDLHALEVPQDDHNDPCSDPGRRGATWWTAGSCAHVGDWRTPVPGRAIRRWPCHW